MKRLFLFCLTFLILLSNIVYAGQEKIVTSETLTISDIESSILVAPLKKTGVPLTVLGIHQNKNSATVYVQVKGEKPETFSLIRFNSGKWYWPLGQKFVQKYD